MTDASHEDHLELVAQIVGAYVTKNPLPRAELPALIANVAATLSSLGSSTPAAPAQAKQAPAVPIRKSITPDYLISLEDGQRFKSLKRALAVRYGLTPDQYRAKWGLPPDYPMVAPGYSKRRSEVAKEIGLGQPSRPTRKRRPARAKAT